MSWQSYGARTGRRVVCVGEERQLSSSISHVLHFEQEVSGQLALHAQIPLLAIRCPVATTDGIASVGGRARNGRIVGREVRINRSQRRPRRVRTRNSLSDR